MASKEYHRAYARRWRLENPEKAKEADRRKYSKYKEKIKERSTKYYAANKEKISDYRKTERAKFPYLASEGQFKSRSKRRGSLVQKSIAYKAKLRREDPARAILYGAKASAKVRGLAFEITKDDITLNQVCPWLKIPLDYELGQGRIPNSPSLDRTDSTKGYISGNVEVVSWRANSLKNNATLQELVLMGEEAKRRLEARNA